MMVTKLLGLNRPESRASNVEVERRAVAPTTIEAALSPSSTPSLGSPEDATPAFCSNRLLEARVLPTTKTDFLSALGAHVLKQKSALNAWQHRSKTNGDQSVRDELNISTPPSPRTGEAKGLRRARLSSRPPSGPPRPCAALISSTAAL